MYNSVSIRFGFSEIGFILQQLLLHGMTIRHINSTLLVTRACFLLAKRQ